MLAIDHFVLTVADPDKTAAFYQEALGLEIVRFGENRLALACGRQKINLHRAGAEIAPHAASPTPGGADFCLLTDEPLTAVAGRLAALGVPVELGPVPRTGAAGPIVSLYVRDPDGNLVEIANQAG